MSAVDEADDVTEAREQTALADADIVILDVSMPDVDPLARSPRAG